ncbi:Acylphosphatase-like domain-containing protein [Aspergillus filifer]
MSTPQRIAFKVHGTVQGVGFRDYTMKRAVEYGLKGWVKNTDCGRVEGEAQGPEDTLQKFLKDINTGPRMAHVVKLENKNLESRDDEVEFALRKTSASVFETL